MGDIKFPDIQFQRRTLLNRNPVTTMSTSNPSDAAISNLPSYPTFEELFNVRTKVTPSTAGRRIFWELNGPFPAALHVMKDIHSPTSLTPYFRMEPGILFHKNHFASLKYHLSSSASRSCRIGSLIGRIAT